MTSDCSHFLLFSEASQDHDGTQSWRFVLQNVHSQRRLCASDQEAGLCSERLELLAVVRGLEALDGPARVTLVTKSRYVSRGIKKGLAEWRANGWRWERFGRIVPIRDCDLWQRIDRALKFHELDCQAWHFEAADAAEAADCRAEQECPAEQPRRSTRSVRPPRSSGRFLGRVKAGVRRAATLPEALWDLAGTSNESLTASTS